MFFKVILILTSILLRSGFSSEYEERDPIDGEYTENIASYEFVVPHKVNHDDEFVSFSLPNFFQHDYSSRRRRRDDCDPDVINYNLHFNGKNHHIQLWPNHGFISPETIAEFHYPGSEMTVVARRLRRVNPALCHYTGTIRGMDGSRAALSLCEGLAGYLKTQDGVFYIEPVKDFCPNELGHHLHLIYGPNEKAFKRQATKSGNTMATNCGTEDWKKGWKRAFNEYFNIEELKSSENNKHSAISPTSAHMIAKRSQESQHRYLEILVVADKMFLDFHRDKDHENYILTVMNMVSDYFHDSSTGSQLDVVVVRIIYLDQALAALDLSISPDAGRTLKSFCKWQNEINPKDAEHPQHHDIAVLITRHDICSDKNKNCDLLGLAYMTSACVPSDACSINEDKGLILGVVIAHELGHIMGCDHDTMETSGCPAKADEDFYHVMSPFVSLATTAWSQCSRTYINELLDNNLGNCLSDEPRDSDYKFDEMLPGVVYNADYQCSLIFTNSTHCSSEPEQFCEKLFCKVAPTKCQSNGQPPADGTKCGARKWCFKQKCVEIGERPSTLDGGWTKWNDWSSCSRTCGGGVKMSQRNCANPYPRNGGLYCTGDAKRYKICNTKPCPIGELSFRAQQCAEFNQVPRNGKFHQWTPYFPNGDDAPNMCVLYCINEEHVFTKLMPRVKDGTPCRIGSTDMCIAGKCHKVGCDWALDSEAINDKCGVCNGDNSGCNHTVGSFTAGGSGYTKVVTLPKGARNVVIRECGPSENTIAISSTKDKFYLNGGNREESDGEKNLCKNVAIYLHTEPDQEELFIAGPLHQSLIFYVVFYEQKNVGYDYEYYIRDKNYRAKTSKKISNDVDYDADRKRDPSRKESSKNKYHWDFVEWSQCTARCNGGESIAKPVCVSTLSDGIVSHDFCSKCDKPETKIKVCNRQACRSTWHDGEWGVCSGCKHQPGFQLRHVWCATEASIWGQTDTLTDNEKCKEADGPKPKCKQLCTAPCTPACTRAIRNVEYARFDDFDQNFFLEFYRRINMIKLQPEGVMFGMTKISGRGGPNNPYAYMQSPYLDTSSDRSPDTSPDSDPKPTPTPNPLPCNSDDKWKDVIPGSKKVKKSSQKVKTEALKNLKEDLLYGNDNSDDHKWFENKNIEEKSTPDFMQTGRQWNPISKRMEHPAAVFLLEEPHINSNSRRIRLNIPRQFRRFRQNRDTTITKSSHSIVMDKEADKDVTVIEAPLLKKNLNFSDEAFEKLGDRVFDTLDLCNKKIFHGKEAIQALNRKKNKTESSCESEF